MNKKPQVVAIIQARIGSSRLPGKVMMPIVGKPVLWHVVDRVKRAKLVDQVVVATSTNPKDKKIVEFCEKNNIEVFKGSENDVLDRYYQCAKKYHAKCVVRITSDCPLVDSKLIDQLIEKFFREKIDHKGIATGAGVSLDKINKYPQGFDAAILSFKALNKAWKRAKDPVDREHVTVYIWQRPNDFKLGKPLTPQKDYSNYRLTVDWSEDLKLIRTIYEKLYIQNKHFGFQDVIKFLKLYPNLAMINKKRLDKTTEGFWRQKLMAEFENVKKPKLVNFIKLDAIVVPSAEETAVEGETKQRIDEGLKMFNKASNQCLFIYLGVRAGKNHFINYARDKIDPEKRVVLASRNEASTKTQTKDLSRFLDKMLLKNILIVSHAYHIPRIKLYVNMFRNKITRVHYWPVGKISKQSKQTVVEINKIIRYAKRGDLFIFYESYERKL